MESNPDANHFQLVKFLKDESPEYGNCIKGLSSIHMKEKVIRMLKKEFYPMFIPERRDAITLILSNRFDKIRSI